MTAVVAGLAALRRPDYGYNLLQRLAGDGLPVDANTLYPLLRRLEEQGLLTSEWNTEENRPRRFCRTSDEGLRVLALLLDDLAATRRLGAGRPSTRAGPPYPARSPLRLGPLLVEVGAGTMHPRLQLLTPACPCHRQG